MPGAPQINLLQHGDHILKNFHESRVQGFVFLKRQVVNVRQKLHFAILVNRNFGRNPTIGVTYCGA